MAIMIDPIKQNLKRLPTYQQRQTLIQKYQTELTETQIKTLNDINTKILLKDYQNQWHLLLSSYHADQFEGFPSSTALVLHQFRYEIDTLLAPLKDNTNPYVHDLYQRWYEKFGQNLYQNPEFYLKQFHRVVLINSSKIHQLKDNQISLTTLNHLDESQFSDLYHQFKNQKNREIVTWLYALKVLITKAECKLGYIN